MAQKTDGQICHKIYLSCLLGRPCTSSLSRSTTPSQCLAIPICRDNAYLICPHCPSRQMRSTRVFPFLPRNNQLRHPQQIIQSQHYLQISLPPPENFHRLLLWLFNESRLQTLGAYRYEIRLKEQTRFSREVVLKICVYCSNNRAAQC